MISFASQENDIDNNRYKFRKYWTETNVDYEKSKSFSFDTEYIESKSTKNFVTLVRYSK